MDREEEIQQLRTLLSSTVWNDIMEPRLRKRLEMMGQKLVSQDMKRVEEAKLKGRILELNHLLLGPLQEIKEWDMDTKQQAQAAEIDADTLHFAEHGRNSPYLPPSAQ